MNLNNRGEVTCIGVETGIFRKREKVLATVARDNDGKVLLIPCDGSEPIGPKWLWDDLTSELCRRVCGKCKGREKGGSNE